MVRFKILLVGLVTLCVRSSPYVISPTNSQQAELKTAEGKALCTTPECVIAASELIQSMDLSVDPCQNFYQYACGGWEKRNSFSSGSGTQFSLTDQRLTSNIEEILKENVDPNDAIPINQARDFYAGCMDETRIEIVGLKPLTDLLATYGGWPMTLSNWVESSFDWQAATAFGRQMYPPGYLIAVFNYLDSFNTAQNTIYIDQGLSILPRSILVNPGSAPPLEAAYITYITDAAKAIRDYLNTGATDAQIAADVDALYKFESEVAKITAPAEDRRNFTEVYNPLLLSQLQDLTNAIPTAVKQAKINWSKYLNDIYSSASITIPDNERVIIVEPDYLKKLIALLDVTPPRTLANYVHWRFVNKMGELTTQKMRDLQFNFDKAVSGTTEPTPRSDTCVYQVNRLMGFAISAKYVEKFFDERSKTETELMIANLKTAFKSLVDEAAWMDSATKAIAKEKCDKMTELVAYPDWIKDKTALEANYSGIIINKADHWNNVQNTTIFANKVIFETLRVPTDRNRWSLNPTLVNAYYENKMNSISLPAGILQPSFFGYGRLANMNYGSMGNVIGHELTHGFDDKGRQNDKYGNTYNWWSDETLANYLVRAQCFVEQYSNYTLPSGTHLNGEKALGENIADNGGLREAYRAYQLYVESNGPEPQLPGLEQFNSNQLFFLMFGNMWCAIDTPEELEYFAASDPHSPYRFRAVGALVNNEDFAREFKCPLGSPMNPVNKCILW